MIALIALYLYMGSGPSFTNPQALEPTSALVDDSTITWDTPEYQVAIDVLGYGDFYAWLKEKGISEKILTNKAVNQHLISYAVFKIRITNKGENSLSFNPEQIFLHSKRTPVGFQVSLHDLLRTPFGHSDPELEKLAQLFIQDSSQVAPGESLTQLLVFRPTDHKFPRKVQLIISRLYYGITATQLKCQYKVGYTRS